MSNIFSLLDVNFNPVVIVMRGKRVMFILGRSPKRLESKNPEPQKTDLYKHNNDRRLIQSEAVMNKGTSTFNISNQ